MPMDIWTIQGRSGQLKTDRPKDLDRKTRTTRIILGIERLWVLLWPGLGWLGLYAVFSLFNIWMLLSGVLHAIILCTLALTLGREARRFMREFKWPDNEQALIRLEQTSGLEKASLRHLEDQPASRDPQALILWQASQMRLRARIGQLRLTFPWLSLVRFDPYALRVLLGVVLLVAALSAGPDSGQRILTGLSPDFGGAPDKIALDLWVTPPEYTGRAPLLLSRLSKENNTASILIPSGSKLNATLKGGWRTPWARIGPDKISFEEDDEHNYRLETIVISGSELTIGQGGRLHRQWPVEIVPDAPPIAVFPTLPEKTLGNALKISYEAYDDYGISSLALRLKGSEGLFGSEHSLELVPPQPHGSEPGAGVTYQDLTSSQWAGEEVRMTLIATDALAQQGQSLPIPFILPERVFKHPIAQALVTIRKSLFLHPDNRDQASFYLNAIAQSPQDYNDNLLIYTGLRAAHWRLEHDPDMDGVRDVTRILWDIALELEEGQSGAAERALRKAMQELMSALQQDTGKNIATLMEHLRQKMADMMQAQMEQMQAGDQPEQELSQSPNGQSQMLTPSMLERMMQQIEDMAAAGNMKGAMDMLAQMQNMMENLQTAQSQSQSQSDMERAMAAGQALQGLENLMAMQRDLMNNTVRQSLSEDQSGQTMQQNQTGQQSQMKQQGQESQDGQEGQGWQDLAQAQHGLGQTLNGVDDTLDKAGIPRPGALDAARRAMGQAENSLAHGEGIPSIRRQGEALDALKSARNALGEALNEAMQQMQQAGMRQDPLGRPNNQGFSNEDVRIPSEADVLRTREIREELQRRLADPDRPANERAYIRRLLERFR